MPDLEKVIKGFTCCDGAAVHLGHCQEDCPYFGESERADKCVEKLHSDALTLLKAKDVPETNVWEWISVKDRLPPIYQMVLITGKNGDGGSFGVIKGSYDGHNYNWYRDDIGHYVNSRGDIVTHWMPLPEPPKEEEVR